MYQSYPTSASTMPNTSLQFHHQQLASSSVGSMMNTDNSTLISACTMSSLTINDNMTNVSVSKCHETTNVKTDAAISNCENTATTTVFTSVETLPDNFLDDALTPSSISKPTNEILATNMIWGDDKKNIEMCFWDDNNNDSENNERKNDDLIYGGLSGIPQHIIVSSASPPPPSNALHSLVTVCF